MPTVSLRIKIIIHNAMMLPEWFNPAGAGHCETLQYSGKHTAST